MNIGSRNLWREKTRLIVSVGGLAVAVVLIMLLNGVFAGTESQVTAYIRESPDADVWAMQSGVNNMHMATSSLPADLARRLTRVPGVRGVSRIQYMTATLKLAGERQFTYLVGFDPTARAGGPWKMAEGTSQLRPGQVVLDETLAAKRGLRVGDQVSILGRRFRVAGLSAETFSLASTFTFIRDDDFTRITRIPGRVSFLLIDADRPAAQVARSIKDRLPAVNALPRADMVESEAGLIRQMGIDLVNIMAIIGFIIGALIVGLTVYTLTVQRTRDFGILKAVGAGRWRLYRIVLEQSALCVLLGFAAGVLLSYGLSALIEAWFPELKIVYSRGLLIQAALALIIMGLVASYMPARRVAGLDPAGVFGGK